MNLYRNNKAENLKIKNYWGATRAPVESRYCSDTRTHRSNAQALDNYVIVNVLWLYYHSSGVSQSSFWGLFYMRDQPNVLIVIEIVVIYSEIIRINGNYYSYYYVIVDSAREFLEFIQWWISLNVLDNLIGQVIVFPVVFMVYSCRNFLKFK